MQGHGSLAKWHISVASVDGHGSATGQIQAVAGSPGVPSVCLGARLEYRFSNVLIGGHHNYMDPTVGY